MQFQQQNARARCGRGSGRFSARCSFRKERSRPSTSTRSSSGLFLVTLRLPLLLLVPLHLEEVGPFCFATGAPGGHPRTEHGRESPQPGRATGTNDPRLSAGSAFALPADDRVELPQQDLLHDKSTSSSYFERMGYHESSAQLQGVLPPGAAVGVVQHRDHSVILLPPNNRPLPQRGDSSDEDEGDGEDDDDDDDLDLSPTRRAGTSTPLAPLADDIAPRLPTIFSGEQLALQGNYDGEWSRRTTEEVRALDPTEEDPGAEAEAEALSRLQLQDNRSQHDRRGREVLGVPLSLSRAKAGAAAPAPEAQEVVELQGRPRARARQPDHEPVSVAHVDSPTDIEDLARRAASCCISSVHALRRSTSTSGESTPMNDQQFGAVGVDDIEQVSLMKVEKSSTRSFRRGRYTVPGPGDEVVEHHVVEQHLEPPAPGRGGGADGVEGPLTRSSSSCSTCSNRLNCRNSTNSNSSSRSRLLQFEAGGPSTSTSSTSCTTLRRDLVLAALTRASTACAGDGALGGDSDVDDHESDLTPGGLGSFGDAGRGGEEGFRRAVTEAAHNGATMIAEGAIPRRRRGSSWPPFLGVRDKTRLDRVRDAGRNLRANDTSPITTSTFAASRKPKQPSSRRSSTPHGSGADADADAGEDQDGPISATTGVAEMLDATDRSVRKSKAEQEQASPSGEGLVSPSDCSFPSQVEQPFVRQTSSEPASPNLAPEHREEISTFAWLLKGHSRFASWMCGPRGSSSARDNDSDEDERNMLASGGLHICSTGRGSSRDGDGDGRAVDLGAVLEPPSGRVVDGKWADGARRIGDGSCDGGSRRPASAAGAPVSSGRRVSSAASSSTATPAGARANRGSPACPSSRSTMSAPAGAASTTTGGGSAATVKRPSAASSSTSLHLQLHRAQNRNTRSTSFRRQMSGSGSSSQIRNIFPPVSLPPSPAGASPLASDSDDEIDFMGAAAELGRPGGAATSVAEGARGMPEQATERTFDESVVVVSSTSLLGKAAEDEGSTAKSDHVDGPAAGAPGLKMGNGPLKVADRESRKARPLSTSASASPAARENRTTRHRQMRPPATLTRATSAPLSTNIRPLLSAGSSAAPGRTLGLGSLRPGKPSAESPHNPPTATGYAYPHAWRPRSREQASHSSSTGQLPSVILMSPSPGEQQGVDSSANAEDQIEIESDEQTHQRPTLGLRSSGLGATAGRGCSSKASSTGASSALSLASSSNGIGHARTSSRCRLTVSDGELALFTALSGRGRGIHRYESPAAPPFQQSSPLGSGDTQRIVDWLELEKQD